MKELSIIKSQSKSELSEKHVDVPYGKKTSMFNDRKRRNSQLLIKSNMSNTEVVGNSAERDVDFNTFVLTNKSQSNKELSRRDQTFDLKSKNAFSCDVIYYENIFFNKPIKTKKENSLLYTDVEKTLIPNEEICINSNELDDDIAIFEAINPVSQSTIPKSSASLQSSTHHNESTNEANQRR